MATGGQDSESEEEVELVVELSNSESHSESFTDDTSSISDVTSSSKACSLLQRLKAPTKSDLSRL